MRRFSSPTLITASPAIGIVSDGENVVKCSSCSGVNATTSMSCPSNTMASTGTAIGRLPKPKKPPKSITTELACAVAHDRGNEYDYILAFDRAKNVSAQKITHPHGLRKAHGRGFRQAHTRRRRHAAWCVALCVSDGYENDQAAAKAEYARRPLTLIFQQTMEAFQLQNPPGYVLVTSMAVARLGFLYPSLVAVRSRIGYPNGSVSVSSPYLVASNVWGWSAVAMSMHARIVVSCLKCDVFGFEIRADALQEIPKWRSGPAPDIAPSRHRCA